MSLKTCCMLHSINCNGNCPKVVERRTNLSLYRTLAKVSSFSSKLPQMGRKTCCMSHNICCRRNCPNFVERGTCCLFYIALLQMYKSLPIPTNGIQSTMHFIYILFTCYFVCLNVVEPGICNGSCIAFLQKY